MAVSISNGSENKEVADQFSVWITRIQGTQINAIAPPSKALVGEHAQRQMQLTPESHNRINTYYASIDKVLSELQLRFSGNDQEILCDLHGKYLSE